MFVEPGKSMLIASTLAAVIGCKRSIPSLKKPLRGWASLGRFRLNFTSS
jgi:hypothetical protein